MFEKFPNAVVNVQRIVALEINANPHKKNESKTYSVYAVVKVHTFLLDIDIAGDFTSEESAREYIKETVQDYGMNLEIFPSGNAIDIKYIGACYVNKNFDGTEEVVANIGQYSGIKIADGNNFSSFLNMLNGVKENDRKD